MIVLQNLVLLFAVITFIINRHCEPRGTKREAIFHHGDFVSYLKRLLRYARNDADVTRFNLTGLFTDLEYCEPSFRRKLFTNGTELTVLVPIVA